MSECVRELREGGRGRESGGGGGGGGGEGRKEGSEGR